MKPQILKAIGIALLLPISAGHAPAATGAIVAQFGSPDDIPSEGLLVHYNFKHMSQAELHGKTEIQLTNAGLMQEALRINGIYSMDRPDGCDVIINTPELDYSAFTVDLKFKAFKFSTYTPLLSGGEHRWFTLLRDPTGHLAIGFNSQAFIKPTQTFLTANKWYTVVCSVNLKERMVMVFIDGREAARIALPEDFALDIIGAKYQESDKTWSFKNTGGSTGRMFDGLIGEVAIYDRALLPDDCKKLSSRP